MSNKWPRVPLGEVLQPVSRPEPVESDKLYRLLGAHWYAKGLYVKEEKLGSEIRARSVYRVEKGDFVYNRLFAWMGSFAFADTSVHNCYVSNEFPCFHVHPERLDGRFLWRYFSRTDSWKEALGLSTGGTPTSRNRLKEARLLGMAISLPSLVEQQRIVARVEAIASRIAEAQRLREELTEDGDRLLVQMAHRSDLNDAYKLANGWRQIVLSEVLTQTSDPVTVDTATEYPNFGIYSFARGLFHKTPINGLETSATTLYRAHAGYFIYSRLFAFEGSYGWVTPEFNGKFVSAEYPMFDCEKASVRPEFLAAYFKAKHIWSAVAVGSKGLGDRRQRVQPKHFLTHKMWLPPIYWQHRIADAWSQLNTLRALQDETATELDALLPSVLNQAFAGKL